MGRFSPTPSRIFSVNIQKIITVIQNRCSPLPLPGRLVDLLLMFDTEWWNIRASWWISNVNIFERNQKAQKFQNRLFWVIINDFWDKWSPYIWLHILSRRHIKDYFIFGTLNRVCINEIFDSMYGWYSFNAQIMWKICHFGWFLVIFGTFGAQIGPHILLQTPYEWLFYLWDTQSCMYQWEIWFNVWVIWL